MLRISSPIDLPGPRRANGDPDIRVEFGTVESGTSDQSGAEEIRLTFEGIGSFGIFDGERVVIDPEDKISETTLQSYLIGPVMGSVLFQRGYLVLHASSVSIRDSAVAFLGPSGAGKSTIAASIHDRGHGFLSDDITAVDVGDGKPKAVPGFPIVKLAPEFGNEFDVGSELPSSGTGNKSLYRIPNDHRELTRPLERVYVITDGNLEITTLSPGEAMQALVGNTYTPSLLDSTSIGKHFHQCTRLAKTAKVRQLSRPRNMDVLADVIRQIERDVHRCD